MDRAPLGSPESLAALCYPRPGPACARRLWLLALNGVEYICTDTKPYPGGARLLGKGHTASVALALTPRGAVVVKSLRLDAASLSLVEECRLLQRASSHGASPRPLACDHDFIVMEYVPGPTLEEVIQQHRASRPEALRAALEAARALDAAGVLHYEIHRPWRNIVYTDHTTTTALVVDLDSAGYGCGNLNRLAQALIRRLAGAPPAGLRALMRRYKESCDAGHALDIIRETMSVLGP